jgi:hypothetical protein
MRNRLTFPHIPSRSCYYDGETFASWGFVYVLLWHRASEFMIFCRLFIAAVLGLAACQSAAPSKTMTEVLATEPVPTTITTATTEPRSSAQMLVMDVNTPPPPTNQATTQWLETVMNGVHLGMWRPDGWEAVVNEGLVLAEPGMSTSGFADGGMLVYVSVPSLSEFEIDSDDSNIALTALQQVVRMPSHTEHDVGVTEPMGFNWDDFPAAYYLFSTGDGVRMLVLALAIPDKQQIVVCIISIAASEKLRIRAALPWLLDGLEIDGVSLRGESLDVLPNPLPFPRYHQTPSMGR